MRIELPDVLTGFYNIRVLKFNTPTRKVVPTSLSSNFFDKFQREIVILTYRCENNT